MAAELDRHGVDARADVREGRDVLPDRIRRPLPGRQGSRLDERVAELFGAGGSLQGLLVLRARGGGGVDPEEDRQAVEGLIRVVRGPKHDLDQRVVGVVPPRLVDQTKRHGRGRRRLLRARGQRDEQHQRDREGGSEPSHGRCAHSRARRTAPP